MSDENISVYTAEELDRMIQQGDTLTDWERVRNMTDEEIEANVDEEDEGTFDFSKGYATSGHPADRPRVGVQVAPDVETWFRSHHPDDYEARMNAVLRDFVERQEHPHADEGDAA
jgi:uncharacterized protein (DUF4415 family)